jgi:hypothetical protein
MFTVPAEHLRVPLTSAQLSARIEWPAGEDLLIEGLPLHVRELRIGRGALAVKLDPSDVVELTVDPTTLPGALR